MCDYCGVPEVYDNCMLCYECRTTYKAELVRLYSTVEDGGNFLYPEISECIRLKDLYEERLKYLLEHKKLLDLYGHYETHFRKKIRENTLLIEAAREALNKWTERRDCSRSTTPPAGQEPPPSDSL